MVNITFMLLQSTAVSSADENSRNVRFFQDNLSYTVSAALTSQWKLCSVTGTWLPEKLLVSMKGCCGQTESLKCFSVHVLACFDSAWLGLAWHVNPAQQEFASQWKHGYKHWSVSLNDDTFVSGLFFSFSFFAAGVFHHTAGPVKEVVTCWRWAVCRGAVRDCCLQLFITLQF